MIIDTSYFFGDILIGQISEQSVQDKLNWFINQNEPEILTGLLGYETYKAFAAGILINPVEQKWADLKGGAEYTDGYGNTRKWAGIIAANGTYKESLIANYVYCNYQRSQVTTTSGTGEGKTKTQNASPESPAQKVVTAWNKMVTMNIELYDFMFAKQADYPGWLAIASQRYFPRWDFGGFRKNSPRKFLTPINILGI